MSKTYSPEEVKLRDILLRMKRGYYNMNHHKKGCPYPVEESHGCSCPLPDIELRIQGQTEFIHALTEAKVYFEENP